MTTALGVGLIGSSSVAGAGRPRKGGGSACGISAGCIGSGVGGSINRSTITSLMTSTGRSTITSLMTSTGRSTMTSLMTSIGTSLMTSLITSTGTLRSTIFSTVISLGGWLESSRTFFLGFQRLLALPQVRV